MEPQTQAALVAGMFLLASGLIGGVFVMFRRTGGNGQLMQAFRQRETFIADLLAQQRNQGEALNRAVIALNQLHEDIRDALTEGREAHQRQMEALVRILERKR